MQLITPAYGFWLWFIVVAALLATILTIYFKRFRKSDNKVLQLVFIAAITVFLILFLAFVFAGITTIISMYEEPYP